MGAIHTFKFHCAVGGARSLGRWLLVASHASFGVRAKPVARCRRMPVLQELRATMDPTYFPNLYAVAGVSFATSGAFSEDKLDQVEEAIDQ